MRQINVVRVQLVREAAFPYGAGSVCNAADVAGLVCRHLARADREHFVVLMLDVKCHPLALHTVSIGTLDSCSAHPREVFKAAILANAASVVLAHNHPSGDPTPSPEDIALTRRLSACGELLGIAVADHVVVADTGRYASFRERGML